MGCKSSKEKAPEAPAEKVALREALVAFEKHIAENCGEVQGPLLDAYLNSCIEVLKIQFHIKANRSVATVREVAAELGEPFKSAGYEVDEDYSADDGMLRELVAWLRHAGAIKPEKLTNEAKAAILRELWLPEFEASELNSYDDLLRLNFRYTQHPELYSVFEQLTDGNLIMTSDAFCRFLKTQGYEKDLANNAKLKIRSCFGGRLTKYTFSRYYSTPQTNGALDPQRATLVFQDMTQPLCSYSIRTATVRRHEDVVQSLSLGVRAFIFDGLSVTPEGDVKLGDSPLKLILKHLREKSFEKGKLTFDKGNEYPVILAFPKVSIDMQATLSHTLVEALGESIAKGVMFEGSSLHNPQFTPAALSKKFLILAPQAPLKPFVGFHVADMKCDGLGVKVTNVEEGTPAAKANIIKDDWLTHVDGNPIANREQLKQVLSKVQLCQELNFRKETQELATIVVGGTFANCDPAARELSNITYVGIPQVRSDRPFAHWECELPSYEDILSSRPAQLDSHFACVDEQNEETKQLIAADERGIQLVDSTSSAGLLWADGKFAENARCGYILKRKPNVSRYQLRFTAITSLRNNKKNSIVSLSVDVLESETKPFEGEKSVVVLIENDFRILLLNVTVADPSGKQETYTACMSAHMLRRGYHTVPIYRKSGEAVRDPSNSDSIVFLLEKEENCGT